MTMSPTPAQSSTFVVVPGTFSVPSLCVACGALAGAETVKAGATTQHTMLTLQFPICDDCAAARAEQKSVARPWKAGCLAPFAVGMIFLTINWISLAIAGPNVVSGIAQFLAIVAFLSPFVVWPMIRHARWQQTGSADAQARAAAVASPVVVRIHTGFGGRDVKQVELTFRNAAFAEAFAAANPLAARAA